MMEGDSKKFTHLGRHNMATILQITFEFAVLSWLFYAYSISTDICSHWSN